MNKVMLIGNVGKDPDVRYYDSDQAVAQVMRLCIVVTNSVKRPRNVKQKCQA